MGPKQPGSPLGAAGRGIHEAHDRSRPRMQFVAGSFLHFLYSPSFTDEAIVTMVRSMVTLAT